MIRGTYLGGESGNGDSELCANHDILAYHVVGYSMPGRVIVLLFYTRRVYTSAWVHTMHYHSLTVLFALIRSPYLINKKGIGTNASAMKPSSEFPHPYPNCAYIV